MAHMIGALVIQTPTCGREHPNAQLGQLLSTTDECAVSGLVMPPRVPLAARRALSSTIVIRFPVRSRRWFASSSDAPEIYDVVCVGGGPAGLSLLAGLKASPVTNGLKVALIEGQDLQKNRLQKDASLESFSNRCSSLTPASVRNLQGTGALSRLQKFNADPSSA